MAKEAVQISNGPESGMLLMRFTLELPNRVLQHFILSQSIRDSLEFMKLFPIAQSQNIPLIEFLTLLITVNGEDYRSIHRDKILKTIRRSDC